MTLAGGWFVKFTTVEKNDSCMTKHLLRAMLLCALLVLCFSQTRSSNAATDSGFVGIDSLGFLRKSKDRQVNSATLTLSPMIQTSGSILEAKMDALASVIAGDSSSVTIEVRESYIATSWELMPHHQFSFGRRKYEWSKADLDWKLGTWSPRFNWDPIHPETVGLPGAFYEYKSKKWRILAYGSAISIPERGAPLEVKNGKITSSSPYYIPFPDKILFENQVLDIQYDILMPPVSEIVLNSAVSGSIRYGENKGFWASASYGYLPMHQPDLTVSATVNSPNLTLNAKIIPRFLKHHLVTAEMGYEKSRWGVYGSLTREVPQVPNLPDTRIFQAMGPAWISSVGARVYLGRGYTFEQGFLNIVESIQTTSSSDISINLYNRFPYRQAFRSRLSLNTWAKISYQLEWTYDLPNRSSLLSADIRYVLSRKRTGTTRWFIGVGSDWFVSTDANGLIGQYRGDDRVRGRIAYAF